MIEITISEYIELLQFKLQCLKQAKLEDSSWNYPIEDVEREIKALKEVLDISNTNT